MHNTSGWFLIRLPQHGETCGARIVDATRLKDRQENKTTSRRCSYTCTIWHESPRRRRFSERLLHQPVPLWKRPSGNAEYRNEGKLKQRWQQCCARWLPPAAEPCGNTINVQHQYAGLGLKEHSANFSFISLTPPLCSAPVVMNVPLFYYFFAVIVVLWRTVDPLVEVSDRVSTWKTVSYLTWWKRSATLSLILCSFDGARVKKNADV